jgi:hypothetical protein
MAGLELGEKRWVNAALKNCDWALTQQMENGWFAANAFSDTEEPLLHTIGYALEGLLGVGELLGCERYVNAVIAGTAPLIDIYRRTGVLKGRYDQQWKQAAAWRCLTGEAQLALVMLRIAHIAGESPYGETARLLLEGVANLQDIEGQHPESYGGVSGSEPIWGGYAPFNYLNWAAKFFMDALLLYVHQVDVQKQPVRHQHQTSA